MQNDFLPEYCLKSVLIIGCGNILFGDDGFGPAVIDHLRENFKIPDHICVKNSGTGVRNILFNISLSEKRPEEILIIDAVDKSRSPGEIFEIQIDDIPPEKADDFSMHQAPTISLLKEIKEKCNIKVRIIACQTAYIPEEISQGLSEPVQKAVSELSSQIQSEYL